MLEETAATETKGTKPERVGTHVSASRNNTASRGADVTMRILADTEAAELERAVSVWILAQIVLCHDV